MAVPRTLTRTERLRRHPGLMLAVAFPRVGVGGVTSGVVLVGGVVPVVGGGALTVWLGVVVVTVVVKVVGGVVTVVVVVVGGVVTVVVVVVGGVVVVVVVVGGGSGG